MARTLALAGLLLVVGAGCSGRPDEWAKLQRPLHIGRLAAGARCPVSATVRGSVAYRIGRGLGHRPAYPIMGSSLRIEWPPPGVDEFTVGGWGGQRVLWFVAPGYRGPLLIRGRRLDGTDPVRFDRGTIPGRELRIAAGAEGRWPLGVERDDGQRYRPSYTRLRAPGCYAYQVDGTSFSYTIVFRAVLGVEAAPLTSRS